MCIFPSEDTPGAELYSVYTEDAAGLDHVTLKDNLPARNRRSRQQESADSLSDHDDDGAHSSVCTFSVSIMWPCKYVGIDLTNIIHYM